MRMKVVLYIRVSTEKQEAENQERQLREYCSKKNYQVIHVFKDVISGKTKSRPDFDKMFVASHKRLFEHVLFWDISRFSRAGTLFTLQKLKELDNIGITWESFQEPYFNSIGDFKDVVISILSTLAKIERKKISERTKAGLQNSKNKHLIGKRGKDHKPRKTRSDKGIKRGVNKKDIFDLRNL
jgi:DNA invertase Pin-like site-specific DNA recombinase